MKANALINEFIIPKNKWVMLLSTADKYEAGDNLIDLVQTAYSITKNGSFVNSIKDVIPSDWRVYNWDKDPDIDATVFYRRPRPGENWSGFKIQGIGHDGQKLSKQHVINQVAKLLLKNGWWSETSDAMRHILSRLGAHAVTNQRTLQRLFNDSELTMITADTYTRRLTTDHYITETVFGYPVIKDWKNHDAQ